MSRRAQQSGRVLALDIPSGLDSDTGAPVGGGEALRATRRSRSSAGSRVFSRRKAATCAASCMSRAGHRAARRTFGRAQRAIAFPATCRRATTPPTRARSARSPWSGATRACAARRSSRRAWRSTAGAGKVNVAFLGEGAPPYDPPHPELMLHHVDGFALDKMDALSIGCGMGKSERAKRVLADVLKLECRSSSMPTRSISSRRTTPWRRSRGARPRGRPVRSDAASARSRAPACDRRESRAG